MGCCLPPQASPSSDYSTLIALGQRELSGNFRRRADPTREAGIGGISSAKRLPASRLLSRWRLLHTRSLQRANHEENSKPGKLLTLILLNRELCRRDVPD